MGTFLDLFPRTLYTLSDKKYGDYQTITDLTFRIAIIEEALSNFSSYFMYTIADGETPEILADRFYGNVQAHWIILYANKIYDPQYDWPLAYRDFSKYIVSKYGSVENAQTTIHHYDKVITRENLLENTINVTRFKINGNTEMENTSSVLADVPYDTFQNLETGYTASNNIDGKTVIEIVSRDSISNYDWELQQNEAKRIIKVIKREYYPRIISDFDRLTKNNRNNLRRL